MLTQEATFLVRAAGTTPFSQRNYLLLVLSNMNARCLLVTGVDSIELGECTLPPLGPGEVLVEAAYTGISPGTELRALAGRQGGTPGYPFIPGYSMAGAVVDRGAGCTIPLGTRVQSGGTLRASRHRLWGGHISHAIREQSEVQPVPDNVDLKDGAIAKLAAIAYHGSRLSRPAAHETVAVVGLGPIGQLAARVHAVSGARVVAADVSEARVRLARAAGVEAFVSDGDLAAGFREFFPEGADIVVDSTGAAPVFPKAIELARQPPWGPGPLVSPRFLIQGSYPADITLPYGAAFVRELQIFLPRDCQPADIRTVLDLISRQKLRISDLISAVRKPEEAVETYAELKSARTGLMTAVFQWK